MTTIGEYFDRTLIRGINEGIGRDDIVQSFHGTPADGTLELPVGPQGPDGPQGPPAHPFRHEGDIADQAALTALAANLRPVHAGKAWRVRSTNRVMVWNGRAFDTFAEAFGGRGPTGETITLTLGTVTTGPVGSDADITITGTPPAQTVDVVVPRGVKGAKGPIGGPGPIRQASDYDNSVTHIDRMVPLWDTGTAKWTPTPYPGWRGPWTVVEHQAWDGSSGFIATSNTTTIPYTIGQINIPAQDTAWRPFVTGGGLIRTNDSSGNSPHIAAYLGTPTGQTVAHGTGMPDSAWCFANLIPYHGSISALPPDSTVGTVAAGVPTTIYIRLDSPTGGGITFYFDRNLSHLAVWAVPVTGAPE